MREAHEMPSCSEELPFYPRVTVQKIGSTRKATSFTGATGCKQPKLVSTSEAARGAACLLAFATSVVPPDRPFSAAGTRTGQFAGGERVAGIHLGPNGRIHREPHSLRHRHPAPVQGTQDRQLL